MDAKLYAEAIEYERLTQTIYQAIFLEGWVRNTDVEHDFVLAGRSGVEHQIDVF